MGSRSMRVQRSRGAVNGAVLVALGVWAILVQQIGPYVDFGYSPDDPWNFSNGQLLYQVLPGAAVVLGGVMLAGAADRVTGSLGGWLACAGGAWLILGPVLNRLWDSDGSLIGAPLGEENGTATQPVAEQLACFYGIGAVVLFLAATAAGRYSMPEPVTPERSAGTVTEPVPAPAPGAGADTDPVYPAPDAPDPYRPGGSVSESPRY